MVCACVRIAGLAGVLVAGLGDGDRSPALAHQEPAIQPALQMVCPRSTFRPVVRREKMPDLLALFVPPLAFIDALTRDPMGHVPTRPVAFSAIDATGKPVKGAFVGLILVDGARFLLEAPADNKPVQVPHPEFFDRVKIVRRGDGVDRADGIPEARPREQTMVAIEAPKQADSYELVYIAAEVSKGVIIERVPLEVK